MEWPTKTYRFVEVFPLDPATVWRILADTDHLNRLIGLFPVEAAPARDDASRVLSAKAAGVVPVQWTEYPFEWIDGTSYCVIREYSKGPLKRFRGGVNLSDADGSEADNAPATRVELFAEFVPANLLGLLALPWTGVRSMKLTMEALKQTVALQSRPDPPSDRPQAKSRFRVNEAALDRLMQAMAEAPVNPALNESVRKLLLHGGDDEVTDLRPYEWADSHGADRTEVLRWFLYAARVGLFSLVWQLLCPNCRIPKSRYESLSVLDNTVHCDFCGIDYDTDFSRYVELCFSVHPQVRKARNDVFCVGGPLNTPHIRQQVYVQPGESRTVPLPASDRPLQLRILKHNHRMENVAARQVYLYTGSAFARDAAEAVELPENRFTLINQAEEPVTVALEQVEWDDHFATAARVALMPEFRYWFAGEVLAPGQRVGIQQITILFTDLKNSTAYYEAVGDAAAYGQVRKHFDFLTEWIVRHDGQLLKTIGDAVMAAFPSPLNGVHAALDIQRHVSSFNDGRDAADRITLKAGLHHGSAIAVNANDRNDFFGRTVNLAARMQASSEGNDLVIGEATAGLPEVAALLEQYDARCEPFDARVKGVPGLQRFVRVRLVDPG